MPKFQLLLCFTILAVTITFFNVASAHVTIKPVLPQIQDPTTVKDVEPYTIKVVTNFLVDLEKECPKTEKFKVFFETFKAYSKYVCPVSKARGYESDMKAKASSLFKAMSALNSVENRSRGGQVNMSLDREKVEVMKTVKLLQSIGEKIASGRNNKLTVEQQKEIKDGILKWIQVVTRIAKIGEEIDSKDSSKPQTSQDGSNEEKSSTQTQTKRRSLRARAQITALPRGSRRTKVGNKDDTLRRRKSKRHTNIKSSKNNT
ncbi:hypothetical protein CARUB_v10007179mg [Capsella rubella]|uniref:DUF1216 domain-containing protein n=1 Tax=Capsella rubella TaxID=81985 RepID=R0FA79_9BRAS|nr:uncharacterized protein LOC17879694 [Capsella rubella]EOA18606.1 hypothetical protein CARUB_v10007179mg [Capsella rubella]